MKQERRYQLEVHCWPKIQSKIVSRDVVASVFCLFAHLTLGIAAGTDPVSRASGPGRGNITEAEGSLWLVLLLYSTGC